MVLIRFCFRDWLFFIIGAFCGLCIMFAVLTSPVIEEKLFVKDIQITSTESDTNNGSVPAIFANIPIKDMRNSEK